MGNNNIPRRKQYIKRTEQAACRLGDLVPVSSFNEYERNINAIFPNEQYMMLTFYTGSIIMKVIYTLEDFNIGMLYNLIKD